MADAKAWWNRAAVEDARWYIATASGPFFERGRRDTDELVAFYGLQPSKDKTLLEIGAGAGRMTHRFAELNGRVIALDVAEEMLLLGRSNLAEVGNVEWVLGRVAAGGRQALARRAPKRPVRGGGRGDAAWELDGVAEQVTVHLPWGSLLRGLLGADPATMTGLTRVLRPGATLQLLVSSTVRDRGVGVPPIQPAALDTLAESYAAWGLAVTELRPATVADVAAAHSTWGKRLGAGTRRPAWLLRARFSAPSWRDGPTGSST